MLKLCFAVAMMVAISTSVDAQNLSGMYQGYQQGQMQQMEIQRLQLCNQAMRNYLNGGPPPPSICGETAMPSVPHYQTPQYAAPQYYQPQVRVPCDSTNLATNGISNTLRDCY